MWICKSWPPGSKVSKEWTFKFPGTKTRGSRDDEGGRTRHRADVSVSYSTEMENGERESERERMEQNKLARKAKKERRAEQRDWGTKGLRDERRRKNRDGITRQDGRKGADQSLLIMKNNSFDDGKGIRKGKRTGTSEGLSQTSVSSQKVSRQFFSLKGKIKEERQCGRLADQRGERQF